MATNSHFRPQKGEQRIIEDLTIEAIKIHGQDFVYMPRTLVKEDELYGEDVQSAFNTGVELEMYVESVDGFEGDGSFISQFGLEIRDSVKLVVSKKRFEQEVTTLQSTVSILYPREGDLIYFPLTRGLFEIKFVEHENPFYQLNKLYTYSLSCELFQYSQEDIDTGWTDIDKAETDRVDLAMNVIMSTGSGDYLTGEKVYQGTSFATSTFNANVIRWTSGTKTLQIAGVSGSLDLSAGLTGQDSSVYYTSGSTASPAIITDVTNDPFADNRDFQIEADDIFDFTDQDPFSEGGGQY
jgi:hypothetical protein